MSTMRCANIYTLLPDFSPLSDSVLSDASKSCESVTDASSSSLKLAYHSWFW